MREAARRIAVVLLAPMGLWAPAPALAASADEAAANALFAEGRAAMARRDYRLACEKFDASQRLDPGVGTLLNLAWPPPGDADPARPRRAARLTPAGSSGRLA